MCVFNFSLFFRTVIDAGLKGRCFLKVKSVLLEVGYIEKWPKFAYLKSKVLHLKFRVMRDRVYYCLHLGVELQY